MGRVERRSDFSEFSEGASLATERLRDVETERLREWRKK